MPVRNISLINIIYEEARVAALMYASGDEK